MEANPFSLFNIEIPEEYHNAILRYTRTSGKIDSIEYAPFERQVDFWFMSFLIAANMNLKPQEKDGKKYYNAIQAAILDRDPYRVLYMHLVYLGLNINITDAADICNLNSLNDIVGSLDDHKKVFDFCCRLAEAGMPYLIQILDDQDDRPIWSLLDFLEKKAK